MTANLIAENRDRARACLPAVVHQPIDMLKPDQGNPRKHSKKQIGQIARSIKAFGFNTPILIDADCKVVAGHGRLLAARQLGLAEVPTICLEHLTPDEAKAFAIADNRLGEIASWDNERLGQQLGQLSALDLDFNLDVTGFEIGHIDFLIQGAAPQHDDADKMPQAPSGPVVCRPGDLWRLGPHRIYCGAADDGDAYALLMGQEHAAAVFSDLPYNQETPSSNGACDGDEVATEPDENAVADALAPVFRLLARYSCDGSLHYLGTDWRHLNAVMKASLRIYPK